MELFDIAKVCHEANRALCETQGDFSQHTWIDAEDWQIESSKIGIQYILDNPDATPESIHESWLKTKLETGWVYGLEKNVEKKTHPCCVPYDELPAKQKVKDALFGAIVNALKQI